MQRVRLRVPREPGAVLAVPKVSEWPALVENNRKVLSRAAAKPIGGMTLSKLRSLAQQEALIAASAQSRATRNADFADAPWILSGHQPELFHAGVWIKNFATAELARSVNGIGFHILADNDILDASSIAVPSGHPQAPLVAAVAFDRFEAEVPFEERTVLDEKIFANFAEEAMRHIQEFTYKPMLRAYWQAVLDASSKSNNIGRRFATGRRVIEEAHGCYNFECGLGTLADGVAFRCVAAEILLRADQFATMHNGAVAAFRKTNRVRSKNHPFPLLENRDDRWEVPFWLWSSNTPVRERAFVRVEDGFITLMAGEQQIAGLKVDKADAISSLAEQLQSGLGSGADRWKLRPRALMTTFFLRLLLADVFVHGIGGGKYDQVTDELCERFFGIQMPAFVILSATHYLPIAGAAPNFERVHALQRTSRELVWNPDRHISPRLAEQSPISDWIEQKYHLASLQPTTHRDRLNRFREIRAINEKLRPYISDRPAQVERDQHDIEETIAATSLLRSREFAFPLHPESVIERLMESVKS